MIRRGLIKRKFQKIFKGDPAIDLCFQFEIGVNMEPLLKKKALEQKQRKISACIFQAFTDGIMLQQQTSHRRSVNDGIDFSIREIARLRSIDSKRDKSVNEKLLSGCL